MDINSISCWQVEPRTDGDSDMNDQMEASSTADGQPE